MTYERTYPEERTEMEIGAIDRTKPEKLYYQLLQILKEQIEKGQWKIGSQIPTEERLCGQYNVSKATVRLAIEELVLLGYLKKLQGKGTFIRRRCSGRSIPVLTNIGGDSLCLDGSCVVRPIESSVILPDAEIRELLDISEEEYCHFHSRLIISKGVAVSVERLYLPYGLASGPVEEKRSGTLFELIEEKCGWRIQKIHEDIEVAGINGEDAGLMSLAEGTAALRVRHLCFAKGELPIGYAESIFRADDYSRRLEFERLKL